MKKEIILFVIIAVILISGSTNATKITSQKDKQLESTIKRTVQLAVTCIPDPIKNATVKAKKINPLTQESFTTKTNPKGEFELEVTQGSYLITSEKNNYRLTSPKIGFIKTVESGITYNLSFYMAPSERKTNTDDGYTNLTVQETWELIKTPENGIHYLIDVRTSEEYINERIYTTSTKEKSRLFSLQWMENEKPLDTFFKLYEGKKIILYCRSANRSCIAANLLVDNDFQGEIYNMAGGIKEWKNKGLPTVSGFVKEKSSMINIIDILINRIIESIPIFTEIINVINQT